MKWLRWLFGIKEDFKVGDELVIDLDFPGDHCYITITGVGKRDYQYKFTRHPNTKRYTNSKYHINLIYKKVG